MDEITTLQADILRTLASPRRLKILHRLAAGPIEVSRLADDLGLSQPNVSQHLAVLRTAGLVDADRDGGLRRHAGRPRATPPPSRRPGSSWATEHRADQKLDQPGTRHRQRSADAADARHDIHSSLRKKVTGHGRTDQPGPLLWDR
jgi:DNA-binding transcriptional ArsR family regulator